MINFEIAGYTSRAISPDEGFVNFLDPENYENPDEFLPDLLDAALEGKTGMFGHTIIPDSVMLYDIPSLVDKYEGEVVSPPEIPEDSQS